MGPHLYGSKIPLPFFLASLVAIGREEVTLEDI
jgi:hypothetical protein